MGLYGFVWLCIVMYGFVWFCVILNVLGDSEKFYGWGGGVFAIIVSTQVQTS